MKKSLLSVFAVAAGLLMATSCSTKQEEEVTVGGEAVVSFTAQLPSGVNSRAPQEATDNATTFGDGKTATHLQYAVYKVDGDQWGLIGDLSKEATLVDLKTTVTLQLVNGTTYAVVFWADATTTTKNSIYTFDKTNCTITAKYDGVASSDENLDAFYAVETFKVEGSSQKTIELHRPFAQLNIGTADLTAADVAGQKIDSAGITVIVPNKLNLKDGKVDGKEEVTFAKALLPTDKAFPVEGYQYLTMNYLLMSEDKTADNTVTISYDNANVPKRVFNNVPLQRNYRTNIYGNLLTSTTLFNVVINPDFIKPDEEFEVWNGSTKTQPKQDENGAYLITKASEWNWLTSRTISNNITLMNDIDFEWNTVTPICLSGAVFEGNNHTLSNVNIVGDGYAGYSVGLFNGTGMQGATIQNLTVDGAKVTSTKKDQGYAAVILGDAQGSLPVNITNVHVVNGEVCGVQSVAGLVGLSASGLTLNVTKCSVKETAIKNLAVKGESGFVASLVGRVVGTANLSDCELESITIDAYYAAIAKRGAASIAAVAGVNDGGNLSATNITGADKVNIKSTPIE